MRRTRIRRYWLVFVVGVIVDLAACTTASPPSPSESWTSSPMSTAASPATATPVFDEDTMAEKRRLMVTQTIEDRGIADPEVLRAMRTVPRHRFVPAEYVDQAYADHPLPIGYGQTISQPYIVAWMTELLELQGGEKVLEIGTGSGYQAAVLAERGDIDVYSIEIVPELATQAADRLCDLGYTDVHVKQGDGYYGWAEYAPFDAIIVTAAPDHVPPPLVAQLKDGGRLVIPIGPPGGYQSLWQFVKEGDELTAYNLGGVSFVPFTGVGMTGAPTSPP
ncbi:MAG TPA: protein-L-isoaspartate(D-aspartate) O-methyltransferase [Anaerolineae bacterium]|nr:protein-L-isoaspartate(D-aspartate) O-methyltransferase [Anaerolineae bacterium]HQH37036.1 protein-L-isoaspartate(D-aspartate) O-methyltransferase [Anaerolineae bacterium]